MKIFPLISCAAVMACGIVAMLVWGATPPAWLSCFEAALLSFAALAYGYTAWMPSLPHWLWLRPIRGTLLVTLGIGVLYVPPELIASAYLIGRGVRLVWQSACDLSEKDATSTGVIHVEADRLPVPSKMPPAISWRGERGGKNA
jgi:hypothetical protein